MMKRLLLGLIPTLLLAGSAQGSVVAAFDFSQYLGPGANTIDGVNLASQVPANYSDFDPTFGAGAESAAFGTLYLDGTNGSSAALWLS